MERVQPEFESTGNMEETATENSSESITSQSELMPPEEAESLTRAELEGISSEGEQLALKKVNGEALSEIRNCGNVIESGRTSVQHAVGSANQAQSILDGINPKYFNPESRFGGGFYVGADADTIVAELAEHGNNAKYAISYDMNLSGQKVLDLTNSQIASEWGYVQNLTSTKACQNIGEIARTKGYNVIKFQSY